MNKAWIYVIIGGFLEVFWALCLKKSNGFTNLGYTAITIVLVLISFYLFSKGIEEAGVSKDLYKYLKEGGRL